MERCGARRPSDPEGWYLCELPKGHTFPHSDRDYDTWSNGMEEPKTDMDAVIDAGGHITEEGEGTYLIPTVAAKEQCGARWREDEGRGFDGEIGWPCVRPAGHTGAHADKDAESWSFPTLPADSCGHYVGDEYNTDRPCRLPFGHDGEHSDAGQCPATIGRRGEGEHENYLIYQCDGPPGHGGVHHNEEHHHAWNQDGYSFETIPADTLTGRPTEEIIRELAERLTRLEEQPTLTELATSLGRIMERLNVVEENADRVVKIAENLRVRVPSFGPQPVTGAGIAALTSQLRKLTEVLDHMGRHESGNSSWPKRQTPSEPCPVTVRANVSGSTPWNCTRPMGHGGMHTDSEGYTWSVSGI